MIWKGGTQTPLTRPSFWKRCGSSLRADNLLIDSEQRVWLVDWPWASIGAPWFDAVTYLLDTLVRDPASNPQRFLEHRIFGDAPRAGIDAVLAGLAGSWMEILQHPAPDDMPTLRDFQRQEAAAALRWLRLRWM